MLKFKWFSLLILFSLVLGACAAVPEPVETGGDTPASTEAATPGPQGTEDEEGSGQFPPAVEQARQALAVELGLEASRIEIRSAEPAQWPNSCLGLPRPEEMCAEVITPGYGGLFVAGETQWEFRVDESGQNARFIPGAALSARQVLSQQVNLGELGLQPDAIRIAKIEKVTWPDACLGVERPDALCAQALTPGYRIVLEFEGKSYEYHTDETGGDIVLAEAPLPELGQVALTWEKGDGAACSSIQVDGRNVSFGPCAGPLMTGVLSPARASDLAEFVSAFAPFEAETAAGRVAFTGQGARQASEAEQRMLAEWAQLVFMEAQGGRSGASWGLAFAWHREGGIAGFCNDLSVYVTGEVYATSCRGNQPQNLGRMRLSSEQLQQLYTWVDSLRSFEINQTDPAAADAMTITLVFSGAGSREATETGRLAILDFAQRLYAEMEMKPDTLEGTAEPGSDLDTARQALIDFFAALSEGEYTEAVELYGGNYEMLQGWNPTIDSQNHVSLLEAGCRYNGLQCGLKLGEIVREEQVAPDEFRFTVEFLSPDGSLFTRGPCCGADATVQPPESQFEFTVLKVGDRFLVQDLPVYVP